MHSGFLISNGKIQLSLSIKITIATGDQRWLYVDETDASCVNPLKVW